jgi:hypothetical protein
VNNRDDEKEHNNTIEYTGLVSMHYLLSKGRGGQCNYPDAWSYVSSWLNSPSHKENIEKDYNFTGIGVAKADNNQTYCAQIFLKKQ